MRFFGTPCILKTLFYELDYIFSECNGLTSVAYWWITSANQEPRLWLADQSGDRRGWCILMDHELLHQSLLTRDLSAGTSEPGVNQSEARMMRLWPIRGGNTDTRIARRDQELPNLYTKTSLSFWWDNCINTYNTLYISFFLFCKSRVGYSTPSNELRNSDLRYIANIVINYKRSQYMTFLRNVDFQCPHTLLFCSG